MPATDSLGQTAALGLIRAQDAGSGTELWSAGGVASGSPAGLLCFDEVQITDPFTALVLKGAGGCGSACGVWDGSGQAGSLPVALSQVIGEAQGCQGGLKRP